MNLTTTAALVAALAIPGGVVVAQDAPEPAATAVADHPTGAPAQTPDGAAPSAASTPEGVVTAEPTAPAAAGWEVGARSGLPFDSGVFAHDAVKEAGQLGRVADYEKVTGRPVDVWTIAPDRKNGTSGLIAETERIAGLIPDGVQVDWAFPLVSKDEGAKLGAALCKASPNAYVRPGWEMNLYQGWPWTTAKIGDAAYVQGFRDTIDGVRSSCPGIRATWNVNTGQGGVDRAMKAWPGNEYVDVIGVDAYDWKDQDPIGGDGQLNDWAAQARKLGKKVTLPEYGAHGVNGKGDNPQFIRDVMAWAVKNKDVVVGLFYFDETEGYIANSVASGQMPQVGAALRDEFAKLAAGVPAGKPTSVKPPHGPGGDPTGGPGPFTPAPVGPVGPAPVSQGVADAARSMFLWLWQPATPQVLQVFSVDVGADGQVSIVKQDAGVSSSAGGPSVGATGGASDPVVAVAAPAPASGEGGDE